MTQWLSDQALLLRVASVNLFISSSGSLGTTACDRCTYSILAIRASCYYACYDYLLQFNVLYSVINEVKRGFSLHDHVGVCRA